MNLIDWLLIYHLACGIFFPPNRNENRLFIFSTFAKLRDFDLNSIWKPVTWVENSIILRFSRLFCSIFPWLGKAKVSSSRGALEIYWKVVRGHKSSDFRIYLGRKQKFSYNSFQLNMSASLSVWSSWSIGFASS